MSKIEFEHEGVTYTLEFNCRTAELAERNYDISLNDLSSGKLTLFPALFQAAFTMHHPKVKSSKIRSILEGMDDKSGLYEALVGMYAETVSTLLDDPDEGNATSWKMV